jgi:hypothetical protein
MAGNFSPDWEDRENVSGVHCAPFGIRRSTGAVPLSLFRAEQAETVRLPHSTDGATIHSKSLFGDLSDEFEHRLMDITADI